MTIATCPHCHKPLAPRAIAIDAGEAFYRPSKPCAKCGTSLRYTASGNCVRCHSDRERGKPIPHKPIEC